MIIGLDAASAEQPNILFCISDDQSYAHTGANGDPVVKTPAFDRVAREGLRFVHAFCNAPTCGPSRSAILTGQPIWRLEEAGNIHSTLPAKFATYTELLEKAGYSIGYTGKGWGPGKFEVGGRTMNPAGPSFVGKNLKPSFKGAELAFGMRPAEELYDLKKDPHQMNNVAGNIRYLDAQQLLREQLFDHLKTTKDPRVTGGPVNWDHYPYYGSRRNKDWKVDGELP